MIAKVNSGLVAATAFSSFTLLLGVYAGGLL
jgi:hypothetical protein